MSEKKVATWARELLLFTTRSYSAQAGLCWTVCGREARYCIYRQRLDIVSIDNPLTCVNTNTPTTGGPAFVTRYAIVEIPGINEDTIFIVASFFGYIEFLHNFARKEFLSCYIFSLQYRLWTHTLARPRPRCTINIRSNSLKLGSFVFWDRYLCYDTLVSLYGFQIVDYLRKMNQFSPLSLIST